MPNARILAGCEISLFPSNPDAGIGFILVSGKWEVSSVAAGIQDTSVAQSLASRLDGVRQHDALFAGDTTPAIFATIARISVKGTGIGSSASGDHFGITAHRIAKARFGPTIRTLASGIEDELLDTGNSDFRLVDFAWNGSG